MVCYEGNHLNQHGYIVSYIMARYMRLFEPQAQLM